MKNPNLVRHALLASLVLSGAASLPGQTHGIRWLNNYKEAIEEAKRTQKPIFLEYRCEP